MKRIAVASLVFVLLTTNYAYATFPIEELSQQIESTQDLPSRTVTQEKSEHLCIKLIDFIYSLDWESIAQGELSSEEVLFLNDIATIMLGTDGLGQIEPAQFLDCYLLGLLACQLYMIGWGNFNLTLMLSGYFLAVVVDYVCF